MDVTAELEKYGICRQATRRFTGPAPELLDYLDLIPIEQQVKDKLYPEGVVENGDRPLLYYVNHSQLSSAATPTQNLLKTLSRNLACRGERAYLAIVKPGKLEVAPVSLEDKLPSWKQYVAGTHEALNFFTNLAHASLDARGGDDPNLVFNEMFNLLMAGADRIAHKIGQANTLSLIGRALFFRFLCDREIVTPDELKRICPTARSLEACFDDADKTYCTSKWLDDTFNGDFLPFSERPTRKFFVDLTRSAAVYPSISAIVRKAEPVGEKGVQFRFDWATFDFAHVPVGLLSQVYEAFSWHWNTEASEETSVHYTPRSIAKTLVDEAFDSLPNAHLARVLDPACGAGVFLVLAFRRLYFEHWRSSGKRPDTKLIRRILEKQLCGFDISDSALRLAALSLYLTAIELDPLPVPPEKLRFEILNGTVLHNHRTDKNSEGNDVGSLGSHVNDEFKHRFDIVLSNPPWTRLRKNKRLADQLDQVSREVIQRLDPALAIDYQNPDSVPDLPFLWKSMEWCKKGGRIAMALPSRTLFKEGDNSVHVRKALFSLLRFTGIVNCSNVRKSNVWPGMDQPFMLAFALNERPLPQQTFWFISPQADYVSNSVGELRIDPDASHLLQFEQVLESSWILKCLTIGTTLDLEVVSKLAAAKPLSSYWQSNHNLASSAGYKVKGKQDDASSLKGLPDISKRKGDFEFMATPTNYESFERETLSRSRLAPTLADELAVYRAPLLVIKQSLPTDRRKGFATISMQDAVYNQSYYGYSSNGHPEPELLIRYLQIFAHSTCWLYYALATSAKLGVERTYFYKQDFDSCPFVPLEALSAGAKNEVWELSEKLIAGSDDAITEIDRFFCRLFELSDCDFQVMCDTWEVRNPHDELGRRGSLAPTTEEANTYTNHVLKALTPFAKRIGVRLQLSPLQMSDDSCFRFFMLHRSQTKPTQTSEVLSDSILEVAAKTGASRIVRVDEGRLVLGVLNQYRYWTISRARLLAADILRDYFSLFEAQQ